MPLYIIEIKVSQPVKDKKDLLDLEEVAKYYAGQLGIGVSTLDENAKESLEAAVNAGKRIVCYSRVGRTNRFIALGDNEVVVALGDKSQYTVRDAYKEIMRIITHNPAEDYITKLMTYLENTEKELKSNQISPGDESVKKIIDGISPAIDIKQLNFNI